MGANRRFQRKLRKGFSVPPIQEDWPAEVKNFVGEQRAVAEASNQISKMILNVSRSLNPGGAEIESNGLGLVCVGLFMIARQIVENGVRGCEHAADQSMVFMNPDQGIAYCADCVFQAAATWDKAHPELEHACSLCGKNTIEAEDPRYTVTAVTVTGCQPTTLLTPVLLCLDCIETVNEVPTPNGPEELVPYLIAYSQRQLPAIAQVMIELIFTRISVIAPALSAALKANIDLAETFGRSVA